MVLDPQCQTYVPKGEAFRQQGKYFCSRECAKLFLSR
jgi:YHS domain-containing protein